MSTWKELKEGFVQNCNDYVDLVKEIKMNKEADSIYDAMYPNTVVNPKKVEADLGPVIEEYGRSYEYPQSTIDDAKMGGVGPAPIGAFDDFLNDIRTGKLPSQDSKPTNPKDAIGSDKLPLHLVPSVLNIYSSLAFLEGALKYGAGNYRAIGVRFSIYIAALERHLQKVKDGEWADKTTGVPHFSSILACVGIILDAKHCGKLTDDRLPSVPTARLIQEMEEHVPRLKKHFANCNPRHYTIVDESEL